MAVPAAAGSASYRDASGLYLGSSISRHGHVTYTGPSEDGSAHVQRRNGGESQATPAGTPTGASRRERREAARRQGRGPKSPKSVRRS